MKRYKPLKRSGFKRPRREVEQNCPEREIPFSSIDKLEGVDIDAVHKNPSYVMVVHPDHGQAAMEELSRKTDQADGEHIFRGELGTVDCGFRFVQDKPMARMVPILTSIVTSFPKERPVRSEAYRRLVSRLPCIVCGIEGYTQACHGDMDKGMGMKTSDLTCWPGCGPHDGLPGCHYTIGSTGTLTREERRAAEKQFAQQTQEKLRRMAIDDRHMFAVLRCVGLV